MRPALFRYPAALSGHTSYAADVIARFRGSCIRYWPLDDESSNRARELVKGEHGARTGTTLGQPGFDGTSTYFDGVNDFVNIYSAVLNADFDGNNGTLVCWVRVDSDTWTDAARHVVAHLYVDTSNRLTIRKEVNGTLGYVVVGDGTGSYAYPSTTSTEWLCLALTWNATQFVPYINATPDVAKAKGTWSGNLAPTVVLLGADNSSPAYPWLGYIAHVSLFNRALEPAEIAWIFKEAGS